QLADEGAANHLRLVTSQGAAHVFAWGRRAWGACATPGVHPARQTREASQAIARLHRLEGGRCFFPQQHPDGIDAGAFHTDVLAMSCSSALVFHELAFVDHAGFIEALRRVLGDTLTVVCASRAELPVERAITAYPFNSQLFARPDGSMAILAPEDSRDDPAARCFLERAAASAGRPCALHFIDVRQSMQNGGGPACLRLRVPMTASERGALCARVLLDDALDAQLSAWIDRHYRDRLAPRDLSDPALTREGLRALDELTQILRLGSVYDFQRAAG
ncbi:MAG: N-succinylarginine dihydrolase, partial [Polyangiaceae bacterium]